MEREKNRDILFGGEVGKRGKEKSSERPHRSFSARFIKGIYYKSPVWGSTYENVC